jgi:hypothetical protein
MSQARLYTRRLDQSNETELKGAEGASAPLFFPDGKWVVFSCPRQAQENLLQEASANSQRGCITWLVIIALAGFAVYYYLRMR